MRALRAVGAAVIQPVLERLRSVPEPVTGRSRPLDLRLFTAAAVAWPVTLVALRLPAGVSVCLAAAGAFCAAVIVLRRRPAEVPGRRRRVPETVALAGAAVALVCAGTGGHLMTRQAGTVDQLAAKRAIVRLEAVVTSDPRPVGAGLGGHRSLVIAKLSVRQIVGRGMLSTPNTPVLVLGDERWLAVHWHERVAITGRLQPAERGDDVEAVLTARGPPRVIAGAGSLFDAVEEVRRDTRAATDGLPTDPRGLVPALVMGDTSRLPAQLNDDMRATGMTHLNAVSGAMDS